MVGTRDVERLNWDLIGLVVDASAPVDEVLAACAKLPDSARVAIRFRRGGQVQWHLTEAGPLRRALRRGHATETLAIALRLGDLRVQAISPESPPEPLKGDVLLATDDDAFALLRSFVGRRGREAHEAPQDPVDIVAKFEALARAGRAPDPRWMDALGIVAGPRSALEPLPTAAGAPVDQDALYWNTSFPEDAAVQRSRVLVAGIPYLLRTCLGASSEAGSLTRASTTMAALLSQGGEPVHVMFRIEASGATVRRAGRDEAFGPAVQSDAIRCEKGRGTAPFEIEVVADATGRVTLDLILLARGAQVAMTTVELSVAGCPPAPWSDAAGVTISMAWLERTRHARTVLRVRRDAERYVVEAQIGAINGAEEKSADYKAQIDTTLRQCRSELVQLSEAYKPADEDFGLVDADNVLKRFAEVGRWLHGALLGDKLRGSPNLHEVADCLRRCGRDDLDADGAPRLQVDAELLPFPWGILYDAEDTASPEACGFWGIRFQIDRTVRASLRRHINTSVVLGPVGESELRAVIHPGLDAEQRVEVVEGHKRFFSERKAPAPAMTREALQELLRTHDPIKLLYFFCHAETATTSLFREELPAAATKLDVDGRPLSVDDMRELREVPLVGSPLVFLNACSSAQGDTAWQSVFVEHFVGAWGARGVVGTDWKVPTVFADVFARKVLKKFLVEGSSLGDAFHEVAVEAMRKRNPFGLIYAVYASPEIVAIGRPEK